MIRPVLLTFFLFTHLLLQAQFGGDLDSSFNNVGFVNLAINPASNKARAITLLNDGSFLVAGSTFSSATGNDVFVLKLDSNGARVTSFGNNGIVRVDAQPGSEDHGNGIAVDENTGNFFVAGSTNNGNKQAALLLKFKPDGKLDSLFGTNGRAITTLKGTNTDQFNKVRFHVPTGNVIAVGRSLSTTVRSEGAVVRYTPQGTLDTSFNGTGIRVFKATSGTLYDELKDVYVAPNGKITAVGISSTNLPLGFEDEGWATRLNTNGSLDVSFGTTGSKRYDYMSSNNSMHLDVNTGYIYVAGKVYAYFGESYRSDRLTIKRIAPNGDDDYWAYAGSNPYHYLVDNYYDATANTMCVTPDGRFFIAGAGYSTNDRLGVVMKMEQDGGVDYTFSRDPNTGQAIFTSQNNQIDFLDMVLQPDNKIVVAGYSDNNLIVARLFGSTVVKLNAFQLLSPPNNSTGLINNDVELDWSDAPGAQSYEVQYDTVSTFANPTNKTSSDSYLFSYEMSLEIDKTYFWRVRAKAAGQTGLWVGPWKFTTVSDDITLLQPTNGAVNVNPVNVYFDWTDIIPLTVNGFIQSYAYQISTNPNFTGAFSGEIALPQSNFTSPVPLAYGTTYYWRVQSRRANKYGPWSATFTFTTVFPVGIENEFEKEQAITYPNPFSDWLVLTLAEPESEAWFTDAKGASVRLPIQGNTVNTSSLPSGLYHLRYMHKGQMYYQRLLKQ